MNDNISKKNWFRIFSPAVLVIGLSIIGIIISYAELATSGGWSYLGVIMLLPVFGVLLAADVLIKLILKEKTILIWLVELLIIGLIYFLWISKFVD